METKARSVIAKLAERPGLFYEVLRIVDDEYLVAGPWCPSTRGGLNRVYPNRETAGWIAPGSASQNQKPWDWGCGGRSGTAATDAEAMAEVDRVLREGGVLLA